jgi:outer membrane protein OmpA-like peptidoglycan-associated protein
MKTYSLGLVAAAVLALAGCQSTPPVNNDLIAARDAVSKARSDPATAKSAAVELDRAGQALTRAEAAWANNRDNEETQHLAYLAKRRADIALAVGAQAQADERLQLAGAERERARLDARTREADVATQAARNAQANAQSAQANAQSAQADAQSAQMQAEAARRQAAQEAERAAALERDLKSLQARNTQRGLVVTLGDVLFASGSATLQPGAQRTVQQLAQVLQQYPERRVLIEGFTDSQGSDQMNLQLSQRRADAFRQALLSSGIASQRIEVRAHGEANPVADNSTAAGRQQNRRVEVLFSTPDGRFIGG